MPLFGWGRFLLPLIYCVYLAPFAMEAHDLPPLQLLPLSLQSSSPVPFLFLALLSFLCTVSHKSLRGIHTHSGRNRFYPKASNPSHTYGQGNSLWINVIKICIRSNYCPVPFLYYDCTITITAWSNMHWNFPKHGHKDGLMILNACTIFAQCMLFLWSLCRGRALQKQADQLEISMQHWSVPQKTFRNVGSGNTLIF